MSIQQKDASLIDLVLRTKLKQGTADVLLSVNGLTAAYPSGSQPLSVVRGVNFEIHAGEVVGLLGESGCGKTTVALALLGLLPAGSRTRGTANFRNVELIGAPEQKLRGIRGSRISIILQEPALSLNPVIRVVDQVAEVLRAHERLTRTEYRNRACAALEQAGLKSEDLRNAYPHEMSGGQRQRVLIAQATVCNPSLLIADEPTRSLDEASQQEILDLLHGLVHKLGLSLLLITHDPRILAAIASRVMVMYAGRIVESGSASDVLQSPLHPYTRGLLGCFLDQTQQRKDRRLPAIEGAPPDFDRLPAGCSFEPRCAARMPRCSTEQPMPGLSDSRQVACFLYGQPSY